MNHKKTENSQTLYILTQSPGSLIMLMLCLVTCEIKTSIYQCISNVNENNNKQNREIRNNLKKKNGQEI